VYACWAFCRLRDAEAAAAKAAAELSKQQAARMAGIAAVLESEEKEHQKQLARQEFDRQVGSRLTC
jgi:adenine/guanine phosphoribosyltransferase-like PRPP-binding protein